MAKIDTTPSTVATNALQSIPFGAIIGGPLSACIDAQAKAAKTTWEFIQQVGLQENEDGSKDAVYVNFQYRRNGRITTLSLPLLTIVPIPYLTIKNIDIQFKASISASASSVTSVQTVEESNFSSKLKAKAYWGFGSAEMEMSGGISSKKDSKATQESKYSVEYTMDVHVQAGQDDMPAGMAKVLELLNDSVDTVDTKGELTATEQNIRMVGGVGSTYITYKGSDGIFDSSQIKIYKYNAEKGEADSSEVTANDCMIIPDDAGALCTFKTAGFYQVSTGERKLILYVIQESE